MIKYFINEDKRQVIGVLSGCRWDAINKINKMMRDTEFCVVPSKKYQMKDEYRVIVQCDKDDAFVPEIGREIARRRILRNYYSGLDRRIDMFRSALANLRAITFK